VGFLGGLFGGGKGPGAVKKHAARAQNKRAQAPDRWESITVLAGMGTPEAVEALLPRFKFVVEPTITDQEEKDLAFQGIIDAGSAAVAPVVAYMKKAETLSWPLKMLAQLVSAEELVGHLLEILAAMDTEYERDPQKKIQVLSALEERKDPRIVEGTTRFLDDANETVRFHAAGAVLAQDDPSPARPALVDQLAKEDSVRIRVRLCEGLSTHSWSLGDRTPALKDKIPQGWFLDAQGVPKRSTK
jgi:HEAT repeat protein